ncbi:MAG: GNAT family N-acetyltransferase [Planctomycetia bacterium]|nr:GNAT family N-acetyltransferase [Planctomycetia bacterium]
MVSIRRSTETDVPTILALYRKVAAIEGGLARIQEEISHEYVRSFVARAMKSGFSFVAQLPSREAVIGEIHAYALGPKVFSHVLGELTIAVDPDTQGKGIGRLLFEHLLHSAKHERKDILRVELIARESNHKAIAFYQKLGFQIEGKMAGRIRGTDGKLEADIPMAWFRQHAY